jgi:thioredoxin
MSRITELNQKSFAEFIDRSDVPVLVDFYADWCGPCKMMAPVLEALAEKRPDDVRIGKVDVGKEPALAARFGIQAVPTLILFRNGEAVEVRTGLVGPPELETMIEKHAAGAMGN